MRKLSFLIILSCGISAVAATPTVKYINVLAPDGSVIGVWDTGKRDFTYQFFGYHHLATSLFEAASELNSRLTACLADKKNAAPSVSAPRHRSNQK